jgi:thiol-disulfide isomerase/thioredoxin
LESSFAAADKKAPTLGDTYPSFASGIFAPAIITSLDRGIVLVADDISISELDLKEEISSEDPKLQKQLEKDLLFVLEQALVRKILVREAKKEVSAQDSQVDDSRIQQFLTGKFAGLSVPDEAIVAFYQKNKGSMGPSSFESMKEAIRQYLFEEQRQEAIAAYITKMIDSLRLQIDDAWIAEQNRLAQDNVVDKARASGRPTLAEFGATGCTPCDMMQPILDGLRKNYEDKLNVVFVHVGEEQLLGARYGIRSIPVQVFFDASGREVFRHMGFFAEQEIVNQLTKMGITK